ncbi:DNRLRE domain-containing protein [Streptomyces sp. NPDC001657]|uniref:CBM96 family carbohydrate-binding protein n=1 Tax=Streptomyces sp. NPDC001657 TaxID=3154522 RepID=UPI00332726D3
MTDSPDLNVTFYDYLQPAATADVYTITVEQHLVRDGVRIDPVDDPVPDVADEYEIRAAQFFLDPTTVHAIYPAAGASGLYSHVLPHITLNRALLPWERQLESRSEAREPWLALLVFTEGEIEDDPEAEGVFTQRTVRELRHPGSGTLGPDLNDRVDQDLECRTIDLPASVFTAIVPREDELRYLTHMRDVETAPQRRDNGEVFAEGKYAVVAANRFPRSPGSYVVHLVSLEGWIGRLAEGSLPGNPQRVRLCSLWSWSFTNDSEGSLNPGKLLRNLMAPGKDDRENLALRLAPLGATASSPEAEHALERLRHGYTAVAYRTLSGENTYAWYRGPLTPLTAPQLPLGETDGPYTTADHALIYDREHGLFDVSYAAAWTLGRTIALADPDYSAEITAARRELANRAATLSALSTDPSRAHHDADAPPATAALREMSTADFGRGLVRALQAPLVREPSRPRAARLTRPDTRALLADARTRQSLAAVADARTPTTSPWLERLSLLRGVPFNHLVPDPRMLPPESLRAFRIDPGWIQALVAGATDVGAHTSEDRYLDPLLRQRLLRDRDTEDPAAGLLIHSELIRSWPEFDILATAEGEPVEELRRDHLAPDVLLLLWDAVPDLVVIREPGQGIHFGVNDAERISLRHLTGDRVGYPTGEEFPKADTHKTVFDYLRPGPATGVPTVLHLRGNDGLVSALSAACGLPDNEQLEPGEFALELVNAPVEQVLLPETLWCKCVADTFAQQGFGPNFGSTNPLLVKNEGPTSNVTRIAYLCFDTSYLPPADRVDRAVLRVHAAAVDAGSFDLKAHGTSNDWDEATLDWNSKPDLSATPLATARVGPVGAWTWLEFDITEYVRSRTDGGQLSVALTKGQASRQMAGISSREAAETGLRPHLAVTIKQSTRAFGGEC